MMDDEDDWVGETEGRTVFIESEESTVLGPDGEPLRKSRRNKVGFDLRPSKKSKAVIKAVAKRHDAALRRLAKL